MGKLEDVRNSERLGENGELIAATSDCLAEAVARNRYVRLACRTVCCGAHGIRCDLLSKERRGL